MYLQVNCNDEMLDKIDYYANKMSVSRSAICAMFIGQGIMALDKSMHLIDNFGASLVNEAAAEIKEEIIKKA